MVRTSLLPLAATTSVLRNGFLLDFLQHLDLAARRMHRYSGFLIDRDNGLCNLTRTKSFKDWSFLEYVYIGFVNLCLSCASCIIQ
jgi:hypothetical protein